MFKKGGFVNPKEGEIGIIHPGRILMSKSEFKILKKNNLKYFSLTEEPSLYEGKEIIIVPDDKFDSMTESEKMNLLMCN